MRLKLIATKRDRRRETARGLCRDSSGASSLLLPAEVHGLTPLARWALADWVVGAECSTSHPLACCERCWTLWVRARLMEHLRGDRYWEELDRGDFALLRDMDHPHPALLAEIAVMVADGEENLSIIAWAVEMKRPLEDVLGILNVLDLNGRRLRRFAWLSPPTENCSSR